MNTADALKVVYDLSIGVVGGLIPTFAGYLYLRKERRRAALAAAMELGANIDRLGDALQHGIDLLKTPQSPTLARDLERAERRVEMLLAGAPSVPVLLNVLPASLHGGLNFSLRFIYDNARELVSGMADVRYSVVDGEPGHMRAEARNGVLENGPETVAHIRELFDELRAFAPSVFEPPNA